MALCDLQLISLFEYTSTHTSRKVITVDKCICLTRGARVPAKCQFEGIIYLPILLWLGLLVEGRGFVFKLTPVKLIYDSTTWMVDTNRNEIS